MEQLRIQMLGDFSISAETQQISDGDNRSRKVWLLLAYLIYHRRRVVSQEELMDLLWGEDPRGSNPSGALKTALHRVRSYLDPLWPSAGHQLILRRDGGYIWNSEVPLTLDVDEFDRLCRQEAASPEEQLPLLLEALRLYPGDFLSRLSVEPWVIPIAAHYHALYVQTLLKVLPLLAKRGRQKEAAALCQTASVLEPYNDAVHSFWMSALLDLGDPEGAAAVYKSLSERLLSEFGILPPEELRALYREATRTSNEGRMSMETLLHQLSEPDALPGALMCEYDFFVVLCRSVARSMARTGIATHIALISVSGENGTPLSRRSLPQIMDKLGDLIRAGLRKGDAAARCSSSQYILMLPQANFENSCMVCTRIAKTFARKYPHSPARLQYTVYPLEPSI